MHIYCAIWEILSWGINVHYFKGSAHHSSIPQGVLLSHGINYKKRELLDSAISEMVYRGNSQSHTQSGAPHSPKSIVCISLEHMCSALTWFRTPCLSMSKESDKACSHSICGGLAPNVLKTSWEQAVLWDLRSTIQMKVLEKHIQTG